MGDSSVDSRRRLCGDVAASGLLVLAVASVVLFDRLAVTAVEPPVDVVFLLDEGRSMSALVDAMRADCLEKAKKLRHSGMDCRFAVVPFGCADDPAFSEVPLTGNPDAFRRQFENPPASSVSAPLRSGIDAINRALELPFRSESSVFFFMISPQPVTPGDSLESVAHRIQQHGITAIIQAESSQRDTCRVLLNNGGRFFSFEGKDMTPPGADAGSDASAPVVSLLSASSHTASGDEDAVSMLAANGLYSARTRPDRDRWIQDLGGTEESEAAVKAGLDWLARHQSADGSWSDQSLCDGSACSSLN